MGTGKLLGKPNKLQGNDLRWTSIMSRGSRNTPSRFMLQKPGISSGSYGPLGLKGFILQLNIKLFNDQNDETMSLSLEHDYLFRQCGAQKCSEIFP